MIPDVVWASIVASKAITLGSLVMAFAPQATFVRMHKRKAQSVMESTHRYLYEFTKGPFKGQNQGLIPDFP